MFHNFDNFVNLEKYKFIFCIDFFIGALLRVLQIWESIVCFAAIISCASCFVSLSNWISEEEEEKWDFLSNQIVEIIEDVQACTA